VVVMLSPLPVKRLPVRVLRLKHIAFDSVNSLRPVIYSINRMGDPAWNAAMSSTVSR
jgi:hypothetical protein